MKTSRHSLMAKGIMVLLSLMILVFIFTYSWYIPPDYPVHTSGLSFSTDGAIDFDMALGFVTPETGYSYVVSDFTSGGNKSIDFTNLVVHNSLSLNNSSTVIDNGIGKVSDSFNLLSDFNPVDLTGNGTTLVRPYMLHKNTNIDTRQYKVISDYEDLVRDYQNVQYISFDLYVRSSAPVYRISVVDGSYVISAAESYYTGGSNNWGILEDDALDVAVAAKSYHSRLKSSSIDANKLNSGRIARHSSYGDFSEDSVVGAIRVGVTRYQLGSEESINAVTANEFFSDNDSHIQASPALLWIPRSDIYLQNVYDDVEENGNVVGRSERASDWVLYDSGDYVFSINHPSYPEDVTVNGQKKFELDYVYKQYKTMTYAEAAATHIYYDWDKMYSHRNDNGGAGLAVSDRFTTATNAVTDLSENNTVVIEPLYTDGGYYYGKCHINLWIEGCDAEARRAIDGGKFFFGFALESVTPDT